MYICPDNCPISGSDSPAPAPPAGSDQGYRTRWHPCQSSGAVLKSFGCTSCQSVLTLFPVPCPALSLESSPRGPDTQEAPSSTDCLTTCTTGKAVVGGASSESYKIDAGVPQGSIVGPTLFLLYVNDAYDVLPEGIAPAVYADDTTLYAHIPTQHAVTEVCRNLQAGVDALAEWGAQWRVTFEPTESQAMTVSGHRRPWETPPIQFSGTAVPECSRLKLLGVTFDAHLSYSEHLRGTAVRAT